MGKDWNRRLLWIRPGFSNSCRHTLKTQTDSQDLQRGHSLAGWRIEQWPRRATASRLSAWADPSTSPPHQSGMPTPWQLWENVTHSSFCPQTPHPSILLIPPHSLNPRLISSSGTAVGGYVMDATWAANFLPTTLWSQESNLCCAMDVLSCRGSSRCSRSPCCCGLIYSLWKIIKTKRWRKLSKQTALTGCLSTWLYLVLHIFQSPII